MGFTSFMDMALDQARAAAARGEVPVGAVLVDAKGALIAQDGNRTRELNDPTAHAEIQVIRKAANMLRQERLNGCSLYVTLEPCAMCAAAISHARLARVVYGAADPKSGGTDHGARVFTHPQCHHKPEVIGGISESAAEEVLKTFFATARSEQGVKV